MKCYHCRDYGCRYCTKKEETIVVPCVNKDCSDYSEITYCNCRFGKPVPMSKYKLMHDKKSYIVCANWRSK